MKKYWHVINIGLQNTLVYRVNFLFRSVFSLIPLMAPIYLRRAARCRHFRVVCFVGGDDGVASVLHVLHHGTARLLGAGGIDVYLYSLRVRVHCRRAPVPAGHSAAAACEIPLPHTVSLSAF